MSQFTKNNNAGRPKGAVNKITKESREVFLLTLQGQIEHIDKAFETLRNESAKDYLNTFAKYAGFFVPKMTESTDVIEYKHQTFDIREIFSVSDD